MRQAPAHVVFVIALLFGGSAGAQTTLSHQDFVAQYIAALHAAEPTVRIDIVSELQVKITRENEEELQAFLGNAYETYLQSPSQLDEIIDTYVVSIVETINRDKNNIDQTRILPVVKDIGWLESIKQTVLAQGTETAPEYLYDVINTELVVMYAEDTPTNIRYLDAESVTELSIDITQLRELAITNLLSLLPPLERHGDQELYMIAADGNYEASLLLHQDLWANEKFSVSGRLVVAIPARDVLLVTGSKDAEGLARVRKLAEEIYAESPYRISPSLFVRKGDGWVKFP